MAWMWRPAVVLGEAGCVKDVNFTQDVCQRIKKLKIQTDVNLPLKNLGKVGSQSSGDK